MDFREVVIKLHLEHLSLAEIAKTVNRTKSTIQHIVNTYKKTGSVEYLKRPGRPRTLNERDERGVLQAIRKNPRISSTNLRNMVVNNFKKDVSSRTVQRLLNRNGYFSRTPRRKPLISNTNKTKRIDFSKTYQNQPESFWRTVIFTDESKFNIFGHDGPAKVWRKKGQAMNVKYLRSTIKHSGGNVMVWGCMAASGVGNLTVINGNMNKEMYLDILRGNLAESVRNLGLQQNQWVFQQDNDPKHTAHIVREWLLYNTPRQLHSPPQSPDLNPIEHVWDYIEKQLHKYDITSKRSLEQAIMAEWGKVPITFTEKVVLLMPNRLKAVIEAKGGPTRY